MDTRKIELALRKLGTNSWDAFSIQFFSDCSGRFLKNDSYFLKYKGRDMYFSSLKELDEILDFILTKKTWSVAQIVQGDISPFDGKYLIAQVESDLINLISMKTGNRLGDAIEVADIHKITKEEMSPFLKVICTEF